MTRDRKKDREREVGVLWERERSNSERKLSRSVSNQKALCVAIIKTVSVIILRIERTI